MFAKTSKNWHFWTQLAQKKGSVWATPKTNKNFFAKMTKADHKLSKTLFYQNIMCFD